MIHVQENEFLQSVLFMSHFYLICSHVHIVKLGTTEFRRVGSLHSPNKHKMVRTHLTVSLDQCSYHKATEVAKWLWIKRGNTRHSKVSLYHPINKRNFDWHTSHTLAKELGHQKIIQHQHSCNLLLYCTGTTLHFILFHGHLCLWF